MLGLVVAGALAGLLAGTDDVCLLLAPGALLGMSLSFQQFADVTVLGAARERLERRLSEELGEAALIYETQVAPLRQQPPLVGSVRALQGLVGGVLAATAAVGAVAAFDDQPAPVSVGYVTAIAVTAASAAASYRDMLRSGSVAAERLTRWP